MLTGDETLKRKPQQQMEVFQAQNDLQAELEQYFGLRKGSNQLVFDEQDDMCMKISDDNLNLNQMQSANTITSTAEMTTPSKQISKLDIDNLENKIKVLEKQIGCIKDKHAQVVNSDNKKQSQHSYFGTVQKENQVKRIKFLDGDDRNGLCIEKPSSSAVKTSQYLL